MIKKFVMPKDCIPNKEKPLNIRSNSTSGNVCLGVSVKIGQKWETFRLGHDPEVMHPHIIFKLAGDAPITLDYKNVYEYIQGHQPMLGNYNTLPSYYHLIRFKNLVEYDQLVKEGSNV